MEELNSLHLKNITKEKTAESFSNTFDKKIRMLQLKVSEIQTGEKKEADERAQKLKETVFRV